MREMVRVLITELHHRLLKGKEFEGDFEIEFAEPNVKSEVLCLATVEIIIF